MTAQLSKYNLNGGKILHIGAGLCLELPVYQGLNASEIVLVEADEELANKLDLTTGIYPNIRIINALVSNTSVPLSFHKFNLSEINGLNKPSPELMEVFPGIRLLQLVQSNALSVNDLVVSLNIDGQTDNENSEYKNLLVIQTPGEEINLLESLVSSRAIYKFDYLEITCGTEDWFKKNASSQQVVHYLEEVGFDCLESKDDQNGLFSTVTFRLNQLQIKYTNLLEKLNLASEELDHQKTAKQELQQQLANYQGQLEKSERDLEEQQAQLAEKAVQVEILINEKAAQQQQLAEFQTQLEESNQIQQKLRAQLKERESQIDALSEEKSFNDQLVNEEFIKAEAQLELIKDVLIREKAF